MFTGRIFSFILRVVYSPAPHGSYVFYFGVFFFMWGLGFRCGFGFFFLVSACGLLQAQGAVAVDYVEGRCFLGVVCVSLCAFGVITR